MEEEKKAEEREGMRDVRCDKCGKPAVTTFRTYRISLCEACYPRFYEALVRRSIKRHCILRENERVLIAVSGGKDSVALAHVLKKINDFNWSLEMLHINLGTGEYSDRAEKVVKELSEMIEMPLLTVNLADFGFTIKDARMRKRCAACGTAKRYIMNRTARMHGFDVVVTGHTSDDIAAFALKNIVGGNISWILKFKPRAESFAESVVTKARPLFERTEEENRLYVSAENLPLLEDRCPFAPHRDDWKDIVREIERRKTGFTQNFVRGIAKLASEVSSEETVGERGVCGVCSVCGEVSSSDVCAFCKLRARIVRDAGGKMWRRMMP